MVDRIASPFINNIGLKKINNTEQINTSFSTVLKDAIDTVNQTQISSDKLTGKLANGEQVELHQVMIAAEKASVTLQASLEVRNKVVEAYQEIMRMQV